MVWSRGQVLAMKWTRFGQKLQKLILMDILGYVHCGCIGYCGLGSVLLILCVRPDRVCIHLNDAVG